MQTRPYDWTALTILIIGAINWGLIGFFQFDLISTMFGGVATMVSRIVYALVGLAGLYALSLYHRINREESIESRI